MAKPVARLLCASLLAVSCLVASRSPTVLAANPLPYFYLPWDDGVSRQVTQGNNEGTHIGIQQYAWDFGGSWLVRAAINGVVVAAKDDSNRGGCDKSNENYANYVKVQTTIAGAAYQTLYLHLAQNSVSGRVSVNQSIDRYAPLVLSDTTGWACGAHLHFQVQQPCTSAPWCQSVAASFVDPGVGVPTSPNWYTSANYFWAPRPAAVSWGSPRLDLFIRGTDYAIYHRWTADDSTWYPAGGWELQGSAGGGFVGEPAAVSWGSNRIDLFSAGVDGGLYHKWWFGSGWSLWENLTACLPGGIHVAGTPGAVAYDFDRLIVVARGIDGTTIGCQWDGAQWHANNLGGTGLSDPVVASSTTSSADVVILGTDGAIYHDTWTLLQGWSANGYQSWGAEGGGFISQPTAAFLSGGEMDVFAVSVDGGLWDKRYVGSWGIWQSLSGSYGPAAAIGSPSGTEWPAGGLFSVLVRDKNGALWDCFPVPATSYTCDWQAHSGTLTSDPLAVSASPYYEDVFGRAAPWWNLSVAHQLYNGSWLPSMTSYDNFGGVMT